ncbi:hypothetical protein FHT02_003373 [Sphingomonas xinjiangensis]|uniref:Uncharacterized protein n=1 Tax=Sphingomonas xinjiangensis TaxID=643568 RepID=A0A840YNX2_9SPHN|nr:hypothetical protein [Sphingomonas xinjiangensis]
MERMEIITRTERRRIYNDDEKAAVSCTTALHPKMDIMWV